ncbi:MAG: DUF222 domain-containing protein [Pseudonocardia sp.]
MGAAVMTDGLAVMPPGPGLSATLGAIELSRVPNDQMLEVLRAQHRQLCHEQARMAAVIAEVGRCAGFSEPGQVRRESTPGRYAAEETRAALRCTRRAADDEHDLAEAVVGRWPAVFAAWLAGDLDRPRVRVFQRYLTGLTAHQIDAVCLLAVPQAARLTTGQLAALLRRMVLAVDPDAAARWYRDGIRARGVIAYPAADGTITLAAHGLPADQAEAACARLERLAAAAKRAGHPAGIDQIRADLFLGLLDGRFHHLTSQQVVDTLICEYRSEQAGGCEQAGTPAGGPDQPVAESAAAAEPARDERVGIEIRIGLSTLLGHDEHPAEIPDLTLLPASEARRCVRQQGRGRWRFALTDTDGRLIFDGTTRRRPSGVRRDGPPGGIVELHIPLTLLDALRSGSTPAGDWTDLVADIATRHTAATSTDGTGTAATGTAATSTGGAGADLDDHPAARLPRAALRRHTEIRDRTCLFPGCRRRAHHAQQDHTHDHHRGGPTTRANLGALCPHDHRVKHRAGWRVEQPEPGRFTWTSPLGGKYHTAGEPFLPSMPEPTPAGAAASTWPVAVLPATAGPILRRPPPTGSSPRQPRPPPGGPDDHAPF